MIDRETTKAILVAARETGWRDALLGQFATGQDPVNLRVQFSDESIGTWKVQLPAAARGRVLLVTDGFDCLGVALARWCRELVLCHPDASYANLLALRANELGLSNLDPTPVGDLVSLPFADDSFDAVLVNARAAHDGWPQPSTASLGEARRVLKTGGCLALQADNRWALGRAVSSTRDTGAPPARSRLRSRHGYRRLLEKAGFKSVDVGETLRQATVLPQDDWRRRLRKQLQRRSWFAESFSIVAGTEPLGRRWIAGLTDHATGELGLGAVSGRPRIRLSGAHSAGLIVFLDRHSVLRVPLEPDAETRVTSNFEGLEVARDSVRKQAPVRTPEPLLAGSYDGVAFTAETLLGGRSLEDGDVGERADSEERMFDLLLAIQQVETAASPSNEPGYPWSERIVQPLLRAIPWAETTEQREMATEVANRAADLDASRLPLSFSHGDFKWANMLVGEPDTPLGLVDWDRWRASDLATHDFIHLVCNHRKLRDRCAWPQAFRAWFDGTGADAAERAWTGRFTEAWGLAPGWELTGGLAYWVREVASSAGSVYDLDRAWIRKTFLELLPLVHEKLRHRR
jgi:SAM-dependent methyltransferase